MVGSASTETALPSTVNGTVAMTCSARSAGGLLHLAVHDEVVRNRRAPHGQGVLLGKVPRLPSTVLGNVVEIVVVLGEAPPGVTGVVEVVRPDDVPSEPPPGRPPRLLHVRGAHHDLVHAPDLERSVVESPS